MDLERALNAFHSMRVKQITPPLAQMPVVEENSAIIDVMKILRTRHHVWVVNNKEDMKLVGVIRYLDVIDILLPPRRARLGTISSLFKSIMGGAEKARDVMERNVLTIEEDATVLEALEKMKKYRVGILALVDCEGRLKGEISLRLLITEFLRLIRMGGEEWRQQHGSSLQSD
ncbi:CBS domain-containing protein [Thermococcus chitonophagus]|uniref:CBS domain n=1 Tax=Thermococcus chitonophagus TaxID=54262 RepID=A0A160VUD1_9EURY|nr:CBS domain-containing protein [Thermococcus chitonophagus]ASJ16398.1 CBS domain-containing protein [Thermococcus chitonophagus]CUX78610.1 CBS domain [Thermococcus chitonophagus]